MAMKYTSLFAELMKMSGKNPILLDKKPRRITRNTGDMFSRIDSMTRGNILYAAHR
jgi:hypothetical protein